MESHLQCGFLKDHIEVERTVGRLKSRLIEKLLTTWPGFKLCLTPQVNQYCVQFKPYDSVSARCVIAIRQQWLCSISPCSLPICSTALPFSPSQPLTLCSDHLFLGFLTGANEGLSGIRWRSAGGWWAWTPVPLRP